MNSWIESLLDIEDMRRRCAAHDQWMLAHPDATSFSEAWADRNLDELAAFSLELRAGAPFGQPTPPSRYL